MEDLVTSVGHIRKPSSQSPSQSSATTVHHHHQHHHSHLSLFRGDVDVPTPVAASCYGYTNYGTDFEEEEDDAVDGDGNGNGGYGQCEMHQYEYEVDDDQYQSQDGELYGGCGGGSVVDSYSDFSVEELHEFMLQQQQQSLLEYACSARRYSLLETIEEETVDDVLKSTSTRSTSSDGGDSIRSSDYSGVWCWGDDLADGADSVIFVDNATEAVIVNGNGNDNGFVDREHDREVDEFVVDANDDDMPAHRRVLMAASGSTSGFVDDASWLATAAAAAAAGNQSNVIQDPSDREGSWLDSSMSSECLQDNACRQHEPEVRHPFICCTGNEPEMAEVVHCAGAASPMTSLYDGSSSSSDVYDEDDNAMTDCSQASGTGSGDHDLLIVFDTDDKERPTMATSIPTTSCDYGSWSDAIDAYLMSLASCTVVADDRHNRRHHADNTDNGVDSVVFPSIPTESRSRRPILGVDLASEPQEQSAMAPLPVCLESASSPSRDALPVDFEEPAEVDEEMSSMPMCVVAKRRRRRIGSESRSTPDLQVGSEPTKFAAAYEQDDFASRSQSEPCVKSSSSAIANTDCDVRLKNQMTSSTTSSSAARKSSDFTFVFGGSLTYDERRKSFALGDDLTAYDTVMTSSTTNRRRSMYSFSSKSFDSQFVSSDDDDGNGESSSSTSGGDEDDVYDDDDEQQQQQHQHQQTGSRSKSLFPRFTPPGTLRSFRSFDSLNLAGKDDDEDIESFKNAEPELSKTGSGTAGGFGTATASSTGSGTLWLMDGIEEEETSEVEVEKIRPSSEDLSEDSGCCCDTRCLIKTGNRSLLPIGDDESGLMTVGSITTDASGSKCAHRKCADLPCCQLSTNECLLSTESDSHLAMGSDGNLAKVGGISEANHESSITGNEMQHYGDDDDDDDDSDYKSLPLTENNWKVEQTTHTGSGLSKYERNSILVSAAISSKQCLPSRTGSDDYLSIGSDQNSSKMQDGYAFSVTGSGIPSSAMSSKEVNPNYEQSETGSDHRKCFESSVQDEIQEQTYVVHRIGSAGHESFCSAKTSVNEHKTPPADFMLNLSNAGRGCHGTDYHDHDRVVINMDVQVNADQTGSGRRQFEVNKVPPTPIKPDDDDEQSKFGCQFHARPIRKPEAAAAAAEEEEASLVPLLEQKTEHIVRDAPRDLNDQDQIIKNNHGCRSPSSSKLVELEAEAEVLQGGSSLSSAADRKSNKAPSAPPLPPRPTPVETDTETHCTRNVEVISEVIFECHSGNPCLSFQKGVNQWRSHVEHEPLVSQQWQQQQQQSSLEPVSGGGDANNPEDIQHPAGTATGKPEVDVSHHHCHSAYDSKTPPLSKASFQQDWNRSERSAPEVPSTFITDTMADDEPLPVRMRDRPETGCKVSPAVKRPDVGVDFLNGDSNKPVVLANASIKPEVLANTSTKPEVAANSSSQPFQLGNDITRTIYENYSLLPDSESEASLQVNAASLTAKPEVDVQLSKTEEPIRVNGTELLASSKPEVPVLSSIAEQRRLVTNLGNSAATASAANAATTTAPTPKKNNYSSMDIIYFDDDNKAAQALPLGSVPKRPPADTSEKSQSSLDMECLNGDAIVVAAAVCTWEQQQKQQQQRPSWASSDYQSQPRRLQNVKHSRDNDDDGGHSESDALSKAIEGVDLGTCQSNTESKSESESESNSRSNCVATLGAGAVSPPSPSDSRTDVIAPEVVDMHLAATSKNTSSGISRPVILKKNKEQPRFNDTSSLQSNNNGGSYSSGKPPSVFHLVNTEKVRQSVNRLESKSSQSNSPPQPQQKQWSTSGNGSRFRWPPNSPPVQPHPSSESLHALSSTPESLLRNHAVDELMPTTELINSERALQCRTVTSASATPSNWCEGFDRDLVSDDFESQRTTTTTTSPPPLKTTPSSESESESDQDQDQNGNPARGQELFHRRRLLPPTVLRDVELTWNCDGETTTKSEALSTADEQREMMANNSWFTNRWALEVSKRNQKQAAAAAAAAAAEQQRLPSNVAVGRRQNKDNQSNGSHHDHHLIKMAPALLPLPPTGKPPLPPRAVAPCRSKIIDARHQFFNRNGNSRPAISDVDMEYELEDSDLNRTVERFRQRAREGIERAAQSVHNLQTIEDKLSVTSSGAAGGHYRNDIDPAAAAVAAEPIQCTESSGSSSSSTEDDDDDDVRRVEDDDKISGGHLVKKVNAVAKQNGADRDLQIDAKFVEGPPPPPPPPKRTDRSASIGYLETDIDTLHSHEVVIRVAGTDPPSHRRQRPSPPSQKSKGCDKKSHAKIKARSMFNLSDVIDNHHNGIATDIATTAADRDLEDDGIVGNTSSDAILMLPASPSSTNSRAKSMEFLLKDEDKATILPPENQLQQTNLLQHQHQHQHQQQSSSSTTMDNDDDGAGAGAAAVGGRTLSEHELRFRRSLQKLNLPDWYKNSPLGKPGASSTDMLLLRRERQRENRSGAGGAPNRWEDVRSRSTSVTSLGASQSQQRPLSAGKAGGGGGGSVVISKRVTTPDWRYVKSSRESLLQSPMSPSLSPSINTDKSPCFQYYYNSTGISRWSSSRLSSTTAGSSRSTSPTGSAATAPPTSSVIRSSFQRQPYLGWRSSERLARPSTAANDGSPSPSSFYRSAAERLSQGPGYYALRFGSTGYRPQSGGRSSGGGGGTTPTATAPPEVTVKVFQVTDNDGPSQTIEQQPPEVVRSSPPEHVRVAAELSREIDKMIHRNNGENNGCIVGASVQRTSPEASSETSPRSKRIWMESSFVGVRPIRQSDAAAAATTTTTTTSAASTSPSPWQQPQTDGIDLPTTTTTTTTMAVATSTSHKKQSHINEDTNCFADRRYSLTSTTLEEVLDSLLALPSSSKSPSPSSYPTSSHWHEMTAANVDSSYGSAPAQVGDVHTSHNGILDSYEQASIPVPTGPVEDNDGDDKPKLQGEEGYTSSSKSSSQVTSSSSSNNNSSGTCSSSDSNSRNGSSETTSQRPRSLEEEDEEEEEEGDGGCRDGVISGPDICSSCGGSSDLTATTTTVGSNGHSSGSTTSGYGHTTSRSSTHLALAFPLKFSFPDEVDETVPKVVPACEPVRQESIEVDDEDFPPPPTDIDIFPDGPAPEEAETEEQPQMTSDEDKTKFIFPNTGDDLQQQVSMSTAAATVTVGDYQQTAEEMDVVACSYHRCGSTAEQRDARRIYKTCHNCYTYYCSRECRKAHWDQHRHVCMYGRIRVLCKQAILCARDNAEFLASLSRLARTGHLTQGPGFVKIVFRNTDLALHFLRHGWSQLEDGPIYVSWKDLLPQEMGVEVYHAVIDMCQRYDPDTKFVLLAAIFITREVPSMESVPHWEREVIAKCAKLSLAKSTGSCLAAATAAVAAVDANTLVLTGPDRTPRGAIDGAPRRLARELCLANIDDRLRERGVSLRHQFPDVYRRLASYVETGSEEPFPPLTIYPKDGLTGHTFTCVIVSNQSSPPPLIHDSRNTVKK